MNKKELFAQLELGRRQLQAALERIPPERREEPGLPGGWRPADLLAHIEFWENRAAYLLRTLTAGGTPEKLAGGSIDDVNAEVFSKSRALSYDTALTREQQAYSDLLALVEQAGEADLFDPQRFAWTKGQPFVGWIEGNTWEHYAEHIATLEEWLGDGETQ